MSYVNLEAEFSPKLISAEDAHTNDQLLGTLRASLMNPSRDVDAAAMEDARGGTGWGLEWIDLVSHEP